MFQFQLFSSESTFSVVALAIGKQHNIHIKWKRNNFIGVPNKDIQSKCKSLS